MKPARREDGFTLIEMLVSMILVGIVGSILLTITVSARNSAEATTSHLDLTAEARTAINRIVADLREAVPLTATTVTSATSTADILTPAITAVSNPDGPNYQPKAVTSITFNVDVGGDGCVNGIASNNISTAAAASPCPSTTTPDPNQPETEAFCWDPTSQQIYLLAINPATTDETVPITNCGGGIPLLAGKVSAFKISYRSSLYRYQNASGLDPTTGITTWYDLDAAAAPVGNNDSALNMPELKSIDSVVLDMTMTSGTHTQQFTTATELRNVHPDA